VEFDFSPYFKEYEKVVKLADDVFARVLSNYPLCVKCKTGCSDCCNALFDLTFIESCYISSKFNEKITGKDKDDITERASSADRKICKIKKRAHKKFNSGTNEVEILGEMAFERVRCPLLNQTKTCDLYEYRPITCRLYGIPTSISNMAHSCGRSGFNEGESYPSVNMDKINKKLYDISSKLVDSLNTRFTKMADMLIPVSMAILTDFDKSYLGIKD
jgi:Fe-S-cluster containining protein